MPSKAPLPTGPITALPGRGNHLALTIDDGVRSDVVGAYIKFAQDTGARFTFFVTGVYKSWTDHRSSLAPLVESGQIQLGNHTWTHPSLTSLSESAIADQLNRNKRFMRNTFGVDGTPFYRPPYGHRNAVVDRVAADHDPAHPGRHVRHPQHVELAEADREHRAVAECAGHRGDPFRRFPCKASLPCRTGGDGGPSGGVGRR